MDQPTGEDLDIGRIRLQLPATAAPANPLTWRLRLQHLLETADVHPRQMPPGAVLIVQHLPDPLPGGIVTSPEARWTNPRWNEAVRAALWERWLRAARPENGRLPAGANAVAFRNEAELSAALALDLVEGRAADRWWWQRYLRGLSPDPRTALVQLLRAEIRIIPALLATLKQWGRQHSLLQALPPAELQALMGDLLISFDLITPDRVARGNRAHGQRRLYLQEDERGLFRPHPLLRRPAVRLDAEAKALHAPGRALAGLAELLWRRSGMLRRHTGDAVLAMVLAAADETGVRPLTERSAAAQAESVVRSAGGRGGRYPRRVLTFRQFQAAVHRSPPVPRGRAQALPPGAAGNSAAALAEPATSVPAEPLGAALVELSAAREPFRGVAPPARPRHFRLRKGSRLKRSVGSTAPDPGRAAGTLPQAAKAQVGGQPGGLRRVRVPRVGMAARNVAERTPAGHNVAQLGLAERNLAERNLGGHNSAGHNSARHKLEEPDVAERHSSGHRLEEADLAERKPAGHKLEEPDVVERHSSGHNLEEPDVVERKPAGRDPAGHNPAGHNPEDLDLSERNLTARFGRAPTAVPPEVPLVQPNVPCTSAPDSTPAPDSTRAPDGMQAPDSTPAPDGMQAAESAPAPDSIPASVGTLHRGGVGGRFIPYRRDRSVLRRPNYPGQNAIAVQQAERPHAQSGTYRAEADLRPPNASAAPAAPASPAQPPVGADTHQERRAVGEAAGEPEPRRWSPGATPPGGVQERAPGEVSEPTSSHVGRGGSASAPFDERASENAAWADQRLKQWRQLQGWVPGAASAAEVPTISHPPAAPTTEEAPAAASTAINAAFGSAAEPGDREAQPQTDDAPTAHALPVPTRGAARIVRPAIRRWVFRHDRATPQTGEDNSAPVPTRRGDRPIADRGAPLARASGTDRPHRAKAGHAGAPSAGTPAPLELHPIWFDADPLERLADGIPTQLAGVFYLINAMVRLELPGIFEESWRLAREVGGWGLLELLGRALLRPDAPGIAHDPLWAALAALDGRPPDRPPGSHRYAGRPAFRAPPSWVARWPLDRIEWAADRKHLRVWTSQGALLARAPRTDERPLVQVRRELVPYVGPELAQTLPASWRSGRGNPQRMAEHPLLAQVSPGLIRWLRYATPLVRRWLHQAMRLAPGEHLQDAMLQVPGTLYVGAFYVDIVMDMAAISLPARLAGLDANPGWVPDLARAVRVHFR